MNEVTTAKTLETSKANGAASIVEARKRNKNRIRKPEAKAEDIVPVVAEPGMKYRDASPLYAKVPVLWGSFHTFYDSFHYYGRRLLRQCILENDKELLTDYELCLAELAAAQSMAMLNYMDSLRGKGFPKNLQHEDDLPLTLEIHGQTAESLARVFTKLIPLVDYGEAGETGFEFMAAASSFFCRLSAGACVAASESGNEPDIDPSALPYPEPVAPPASGAAPDSAAPVPSRPYPGMKQPSGTAQAAEAAPEYKR